MPALKKLEHSDGLSSLESTCENSHNKYKTSREDYFNTKPSKHNFNFKSFQSILGNKENLP